MASATAPYKRLFRFPAQDCVKDHSFDVHLTKKTVHPHLAAANGHVHRLSTARHTHTHTHTHKSENRKPHRQSSTNGKNKTLEERQGSPRRLLFYGRGDSVCTKHHQTSGDNDQFRRGRTFTLAGGGVNRAPWLTPPPRSPKKGSIHRTHQHQPRNIPCFNSPPSPSAAATSPLEQPPPHPPPPSLALWLPMKQMNEHET